MVTTHVSACVDLVQLSLEILMLVACTSADPYADKHSVEKTASCAEKGSARFASAAAVEDEDDPRLVPSVVP